MQLIEWTDQFKLGVQPFDGHHQYLVKLINTLYNDYTAGKSADKVGFILDELAEYATYHFAAEETWMRENSYPKLHEHCGEHHSFSGTVAEMQKNLHAGQRHITIEVLSFLTNWIKKHILEIDSDYGRFIASRGLPINLV